MKVLLVEDYKRFGEYIHEYLTDLGHSVTFLVNGKDALGMLDNYEFDAVVSDYELEHGGPNGVDILTFAQDTNLSILTILFSGVDRSLEVERAGVVIDHILTKDNIRGLGEALA